MSGAAAVWAVTVGASLTVAAWSGARALGARSEAALARAGLARAAADAGELAALRADAPEAAEAKPASELPARVTATLAACGLPASAVQNFSAEPSRRDAREGIQRERASLVLSQVTLPQVGRFLVAWRDAEPRWVVSSIELTADGPAPGGGDLPLRVLMSLESPTAESLEGRP